MYLSLSATGVLVKASLDLAVDDASFWATIEFFCHVPSSLTLKGSVGEKLAFDLAVWWCIVLGNNRVLLPCILSLSYRSVWWTASLDLVVLMMHRLGSGRVLLPCILCHSHRSVGDSRTLTLKFDVASLGNTLSILPCAYRNNASVDSWQPFLTCNSLDASSKQKVWTLQGLPLALWENVRVQLSSAVWKLVEVAFLRSRTLISFMVYVDVKQHWTVVRELMFPCQPATDLHFAYAPSMQKSNMFVCAGRPLTCKLNRSVVTAKPWTCCSLHDAGFWAEVELAASHLPMADSLPTVQFNLLGCFGLGRGKRVTVCEKEEEEKEHGKRTYQKETVLGGKHFDFSRKVTSP